MDSVEFPTLDIDCIRPNEWNPNKLDSVSYEKLKTGINRVITESGTIPPITVRPILEPSDKYKYEIIDGEHRHKAMVELGYGEIPACILNVGDSDARVLTITLNYLRGEADLIDYVELIQNIVEQGEFDIKEIASYVPQDASALEEMMAAIQENFDFSEIDGMVEENLGEGDTTSATLDTIDDHERYVTVEVVVPLSIAEGFQTELIRIKNHLMMLGIDGIESKSIAVLARNSSSIDLNDVDFGGIK